MIVQKHACKAAHKVINKIALCWAFCIIAFLEKMMQNKQDYS